MPRLPRIRPRHRPRTRLVALLLSGALVVAAVLAYEALDSARSHRDAAEHALREYAGFAAWNYASRLKKDLDYYVFSRHLKALHNVGVGWPEAEGVPAARLLQKAEEKARLSEHWPTQFYFAVDLATRKAEVSCACRDDAVREWIADTVTTHALRWFGDGTEYAAILGGPRGDGDRWVVAYYLTPEDGPPTTAWGFAGDFEHVLPIFRAAFDAAPLLPPTLTGDVANGEILLAEVHDPDWGALWASPVAWDTGERLLTGEDSLPTRLGGIHVQVALRSDAAESLIIGGLPADRFPFLMALLALTAGLIAAAVWQLRREAQLAALRQEFVSNVSHELRTPLAQIRMFGETLLLGRVRSETEARRSLEIIDQEARRLSHLVDNVLQFSRSERHAVHVEPSPQALAPLVREVVECFAPLAEARENEVEAVLSDDVAAPVDAEAFRQVLLNLLDNAVKYGPAGQRVRVGLARVDGRARVWVDDEGPGVPHGDRDRIWAPFMRLEREREKAIAGTGIGLAVVKDLVERHGGSAEVEDRAGGGARFVVELPGAYDMDDVAAAARSHASETVPA